jgi:signal transduction histidine kinase
VEVSTVTRGARAVLRVVNRGPVVPEAEIDRLFQPFQRMAPERTRRGDRGTGLGLSIIQAIADAHGAAIASRPHPDGGLEVEVTFPLPAAQL